MDFEGFVLNFSSNLLATLFGGIILALLFFWAKEKLFPLPEITGRWYLEMRTVTTAYNPYKGMILRYVAILCRQGERVQGTVEKIYEDSSTGKRDYIGKNRTRGEMHGYVQKNYFLKDRMYLHVVEDGHGRESTNFYEVHVQSKSKMVGTFASMVAEQDGVVTWQREAF